MKDILANGCTHKLVNKNQKTVNVGKTSINFLIVHNYWIYNLIRAAFFTKFERLFKKNMYNSIIQSIAHLKL